MSALQSWPALATDANPTHSFALAPAPAVAGHSTTPSGTMVSSGWDERPTSWPLPARESRSVHSVGGAGFEISVVRPVPRGRGGNQDLALLSASAWFHARVQVLGGASRACLVNTLGNAGGEPGVTTQWNQLATHANGRYLLFLKPGIVPWPGALERLLAFAHAHPEFGAIGGRVVTARGEPCAMAEGFCGPNRPNAARAALRQRIANQVDRRTLPALGSGVLLIRTELFRELTGFDPRLGSDAAALDVLLELLARGHAVGLCAAASFVCGTPVEDAWNLRQDALRLRRRWGVHHLTDVDALWDATVAVPPEDD